MTPRILENTPVRPVIVEEKTAVNPNAPRYGFAPYKNINLVGSLGSIEYRIQPEHSRFHREIKKNELIPFETFTFTTRIPDSTTDRPGAKAMYYEESTVKTAYDAATELLLPYGRFGYVVLNSLENVSQERAFDIFNVLIPFDYTIKELLDNLLFDAAERIEATEDIEIPMGDDKYHVIPALQSNIDRKLARRLLPELTAAAQTAYDEGSSVLNETRKSMQQAFATGKGKSNPDPLDLYLSYELGEELPRLVGNKASDLDRKIDFLVDREQNRSIQEENEALRRRIAEMERAQKEQAENESLRARAAELEAVRPVCAATKTNGEPCRGLADASGKCAAHRDK